MHVSDIRSLTLSETVQRCLEAIRGKDLQALKAELGEWDILDERTIIGFACTQQWTDGLELLIDYAQKPQDIPMICVSSNFLTGLRLVEHLIEPKDIKDLMVRAAETGHIEILTHLLTLSSDCSDALFGAVMYKRTEIVAHLLPLTDGSVVLDRLENMDEAERLFLWEDGQVDRAVIFFRPILEKFNISKAVENGAPSAAKKM